jgi:nucleoside-diphosphate-sugar epimerase
MFLSRVLESVVQDLRLRMAFTKDNTSYGAVHSQKLHIIYIACFQLSYVFQSFNHAVLHPIHDPVLRLNLGSPNTLCQSAFQKYVNVIEYADDLQLIQVVVLYPFSIDCLYNYARPRNFSFPNTPTMVNVLVIGATGYIGQALAQSLVRSGNHRVYGLARSPSKALSMACSEVIPIPGSLSNDREENGQLLNSIAAYSIDVVVHVSNDGSEGLLNLLVEYSERRMKTDPRAPKLGFIYTSGTWVHGSSHTPINDLAPVAAPQAPTQPTQLVAWRADFEKNILDARKVLEVMVVRPALVYGRSNAIWTSLLSPIRTAMEHSLSTASISANPDSRPGLVHVDDVASGLHCAVDKLSLIAGSGVYPVFDLQTSQESMIDILRAAAAELGFKGKVMLDGAGEDLFAKAMSTSGNACSGRARTLLGWVPTRVGFVAGMGLFAKSWAACQDIERNTHT